MKNLGIRAFYIPAEPKIFRPDSMPTNLTPDYLSEEYFELCEYAVEKGKEYGMLCCFMMKADGLREVPAEGC